MTMYELSHHYADREDRQSITIIAALVGALVGTGTVAISIAVLLWWFLPFRHHFCKVNAFMRRINALGRVQHAMSCKTHIVAETVHRTLGGQIVS